MYQVSILVPIYGVEKYIARCADSLFSQTYANIEYIFINDCTKDKSIEILETVISKFPNRKHDIHIINHEYNKGLAGARNTGIEHATGEFVLWVDSDDSIDVALVEKVLSKQQENDADIVCFDAKVLLPDSVKFRKEENYVDGKDLALKMLKGNASFNVWGHLIRRSLYIDNDIKAEEGINQAEDYHVMPRLAYFAKRVNTLHEVLYIYDRTSDGSYSNNFKISNARQMDRAHQILCDFFKDKEETFMLLAQEQYLVTVLRRMKSISVRTDSEGYYNDLLVQLDCFEKRFYKNLSFSNKIIIFLRTKWMVAVYARIHKQFMRLR